MTAEMCHSAALRTSVSSPNEQEQRTAGSLELGADRARLPFASCSRLAVHFTYPSVLRILSFGPGMTSSRTLFFTPFQTGVDTCGSVQGRPTMFGGGGGGGDAIEHERRGSWPALPDGQSA